ncbi:MULTISPECIES: hypothetical protein [unclassified Streptomyces]|uniref:hypothetical protein n=1 Tax=unclassified Streptomyces TaxID=2593676 RepID=UPI0035DBBE1B
MLKAFHEPLPELRPHAVREGRQLGDEGSGTVLYEQRSATLTLAAQRHEQVSTLR